MDYSNLTGKSVLITGGTGSFGKAFVKEVLGWVRPPMESFSGKPDRLIVFSRDEQKQEEMARLFPDPCMRFFIGDVRDQSRLEMAMRGVDVVIHAAALKIVPIAEYNPSETIQTNITGSHNVIIAAIKAGVKQVIALSTDKAVNPINLYGATKLAAEKLFVAANNLSAGKTIFSVVRYGNVVGSRGSVLPYFRQLKAEGKPLTVTDPTMTRFWITLPQAVDFVLNCMVRAKGREVFVPQLPSMRVMDLVEAMGCEHTEVGIRPGEKIHETLITEDEARFVLGAENFYIVMDKPVVFKAPPGFPYSSGTNHEWVSVETLRKMADETPAI